jgi:hypothetical protein
MLALRASVHSAYTDQLKRAAQRVARLSWRRFDGVVLDQRAVKFARE